MFRKSACIAGLVVAGFMTADAQDARFEAASIKPSVDSSRRSPVGATPVGRGLAMVNGTVAELIQYAYPVTGREVSGGPPWVRTDRYDVQARAAGVTTRAQREAMLRTLLAERLSLRLHYETVERSVYRLVVMHADGRLGPGLTRTRLDCATIRAARARGELPPPPPKEGVLTCSSGWGGGNFAARGTAMSDVAQVLTSLVDRVVVDATGLQGDFEFNLTWDPSPLDKIAPDRATIYVALEEQLGLKLEPARGPVQIVVIDRIERPTPD